MIDDKNIHTPHDRVKEARKAKAAAADYDVGYCKPPKSGQIKKGECRNPKGRPKKKPDNVRSLIDKIANKTIEIRENGKVRKIMLKEAVLLRLFKDAAAGKQAAMNVLMKLLAMAGQFEPEPDPDEDRRGGVLVVPAEVDMHEWIEQAEAHRQKVLDEAGNIRDEFSY